MWEVGLPDGWLHALWEVQTDTLAWGMISTGVVTLVALTVGPTAPYGRYSTTGWGFLIEARLAWVVSAWPAHRLHPTHWQSSTQSCRFLLRFPASRADAGDLVVCHPGGLAGAAGHA
jgi:hypothetical protein